MYAMQDFKMIKACYWGWLGCRDILIAAGADEKIVDRDGYTAQGEGNSIYHNLSD